MKLCIPAILSLASLIFFSASLYAEQEKAADPRPNLETGAQVFSERCVLCHGKNGMGQGYIALTIKDYPSTNLFESETTNDLNAIKEIVIWGGTGGERNNFSPPWGAELTWTEIESVALFVKHMRQQKNAAQTLLAKQNSDTLPLDYEKGRLVYKSRCVLCHGTQGEGDGKMKKIIKDPPPYNLTLSALPDKLLKEIILEGGQAVGRSYHMPPWKDELTEIEIDSVIAYIKSLRAY